jgi:transcriptional regulator of arginine metabolism
VTPLAGAASDKVQRHRHIREIVSRTPIGTQRELVDELNRRGVSVTNATVSRDMSELGLVRVARADGHRYVLPDDRPQTSGAGDARLRRLVHEIPLTVGRSGLILLLVGTPGTASMIAQAIDESSFTEHEGTLAGDNTTLVLFADESKLEKWLRRFRALQGRPTQGSTAAGRTGPKTRTR